MRFTDTAADVGRCKPSRRLGSLEPLLSIARRPDFARCRTAVLALLVLSLLLHVWLGSARDMAALRHVHRAPPAGHATILPPARALFEAREHERRGHRSDRHHDHSGEPAGWLRPHIVGASSGLFVHHHSDAQRHRHDAETTPAVTVADEDDGDRRTTGPAGGADAAPPAGETLLPASLAAGRDWIAERAPNRRSRVVPPLERPPRAA